MRTIAVISQKGGAGKTTLAIHLAAAGVSAGLASVVIDMDPQATASHWSEWREGAAPEVIDCPPALIGKKLRQAEALGADLVVIDTPPHAEAAAHEAARLADLVLVPCRPRAFDLKAIELTASLAIRSNKPAAAIMMAGPVNAQRLYAEVTELIGLHGLQVAPVRLPERKAYYHSAAAGRVASEIEPNGKAAADVAALWLWVCGRVNMPTRSHIDTVAA